MKHGRSASVSSSTLRNAHFAKSAPSNYEQFQTTRTERRARIASDLAAQKQQDIRELQLKLHMILLRLRSTQSLLATEERDFLTRQDSLQTELARIKSDAEVKFSQAQVRHLSRKAEAQREHEDQLHSLAQTFPQLVHKWPRDEDSDAHAAEFARLRQLESSLHRTSPDVPELPDDPIDDTTLYNLQLSHLECQKRELLHAIRDEQRIGNEKVHELTNVLNREQSEFASESERLSAKIERHEDAWQKQLQRLCEELDGVQTRKSQAAAANAEVLEEWQSRIEAADHDFRRQLREAARTAEGLRAAVMGVNLRKTEQLAAERRRSQSRQQLRTEGLSLRLETFNRQKQLEMAREKEGLLRRELSATIGTRRTASLFL
jgi:hypothetical protein